MADREYELRFKMTRDEKAAKLREGLPKFYGTEAYHRVTITPVLATDGVNFLCETAGAYWLMDVIGSYQPKIAKMPGPKGARLREMQFWHLEVVRDGDTRSGIVTCRSDSGVPPSITQKIEYTDFPLDEGVEIWVQPGGPRGALVAMLPGEY